MKKVSKVDFTNAVIAEDDDMTVIEYDTKGEVVNTASLRTEFENLVKSAVGIEGVKITIQITKDENSNQ